jgi:hypothetical protein
MAWLRFLRHAIPRSNLEQSEGSRYLPEALVSAKTEYRDSSASLGMTIFCRNALALLSLKDRQEA